ncbi:16S rRNA (uracil(1498)-N(3))-methyltransferase [Undibacterium sp. 5I1]|uniref:16S rRNA (uracil(1498)-N(3))-methyltransferase n=1 Tax=unclassified Undibacterium TaxID=2630295 RepID=UPI002AB4B49A|nr:MULTISPECIES: 16S rRNA (uracil(1498)-N(3))-methyltransferase [unclassified Undibacterium]MDY7537772.1 16S rRNA (uracil(1498)-N(3))-methyltransferase [Undibacterium sp. 5I1]MEB0229889.1 16S rRNA (uracil(1498)-N(3))-methyltransferase [Undibacterium sp. 10I3]MEB0257646.1 16S rRNA (uracil(1498)-N(3))-methyltransferase [Undibacterium sp. 5I1]
MPRFFCPLPLTIGASIDLPTDVAHHIFVLRLSAGENISLFNGEGGSYVATLVSVTKKSVIAEVKVFLPEECELPFALTLAQALPEASKMDWIIEKAIELGVTTIQPLSSQRCVVRLSAERAEKKLAHWQGIIVAAAEQCGRNRLAHLSPVMDLPKWLAQQDMHKRILLSPRADQSLADWARHHPAQSVSLMIGPEGGFSDDEEMLAIRQGVLTLSMGPRILRTETAGLAAIATLNAAWGGM